MKKILILMATVFAAITLVSVTPTSAAAAEKHYNITTDASFPPFDFQDNKQQYVGIDQDILKEIAKREHFTYDLYPMSFDAAAQQVVSGQADAVIAGMSITDERRQKFDFGTPYYSSGVVWATQPGAKYKSLDALKGKTVAIKKGTAGAKYAESIKDQYGFDVKYFADSNMMYNDVATGNSNALFEDLPVLKYAIKNGQKLTIQNEKEPANAGQYGFAVQKGSNAELVAAFNHGLAEIKADGTYDKIVNNYLNSDASKFSGSAEDNNSIIGLLKSNRKAFTEGLWATMQLTVIAIVLASLWGIIVGTIGASEVKSLRMLATVIIYTFRGLPLMVLAFFIYMGIPSLTGHKIPMFTAGVITLTLNSGAYIAAFVRGSFAAVDKGQMEAARSLGMSYSRAMLTVVIPQGLKMMFPSFINQFIITLKDTSILSAIGLLELTQTGTLIVSRNTQGFRVWAIVAVIYLIIITLLTLLSNWVEKRINK